MQKNDNIQITQEDVAQYGIESSTKRVSMGDKKDVSATKCHPLVPISAEEVNAAPRIVLTVLESPTLSKDTRYEINAAGYLKSRRDAKDGCTYVGTADRDETTGEYLNDIVAPADEAGMGGIHFLIQYRVKTRSYFIKDCGQGTGTFIKIEDPLILRFGYIISYGDSHMYVNIITKDKIELKFLDGPKADQMLY